MFFWNSLAFSMIQQMLAIWSLVPLPFLKPAWTSGSSQFTCCWSLAWRILSITLLACEMRAIKKKEWEKRRPHAKEIILHKEDEHLPPSASASLPFLFERTYLLFLHQSKTRVLNLGKEIKMRGRIGANHWISTCTKRQQGCWLSCHSYHTVIRFVVRRWYTRRPGLKGWLDFLLKQ